MWVPCLPFFLGIPAWSPLSLLPPHHPHPLPACLAQGRQRRNLSPNRPCSRGLPVAPTHQGQLRCGHDLGRATPARLPGGSGVLPNHAGRQPWGQEAQAPPSPQMPAGHPLCTPRCRLGWGGVALGPADVCSPIPTAMPSGWKKIQEIISFLLFLSLRLFEKYIFFHTSRKLILFMFWRSMGGRS